MYLEKELYKRRINFQFTSIRLSSFRIYPLIFATYKQQVKVRALESKKQIFLSARLSRNARRYRAGNNGQSRSARPFTSIFLTLCKTIPSGITEGTRIIHGRAPRGCRLDSVVHEWKVVSGKNSRHSGRAGLRDTRAMYIGRAA